MWGRCPMNENENILRQAVHELFMEEQEEYDVYEQTNGAVTPSVVFDVRMRRQIRNFEVKKRITGAMRKVAAVFVAIIGMYMLLFLINEDVRAYTIQFIRTYILGGYTSYEITGVVDERKAIGFEIGYVPDGYKMTEKSLDKGYGYISYESEKGKWREIDLDYESIPQKQGNGIDNEHSKCEKGRLENGRDCDIYRSNTIGYSSFVIWKDGSTIITLSINDYHEGWEVDELLKIANHVELLYEDGE